MEFPAAKTIPQHEAKPLNWGIAAPGEIAGMFTAAVNTYGTQNIAAVGSRSLERASAFAKEHSIDHVFGSYDELFAFGYHRGRLHFQPHRWASGLGKRCA